LEKVWGTFTHRNRNFVSSVFLVIVCVAPLILKRGFCCGHTLRGDTRAPRGCGFFGASVLPYGVGCFFAFADVLREVVRVAGWGGVGRVLCYALPLVWFEGWGKSCH